MLHKLGTSYFKSIVLFFLIFFSMPALQAQCAMCRAALESEGNGTKAQAINDGIVYLMVIPYILVFAVGIYVYRMKMNKKKDSK